MNYIAQITEEKAQTLSKEEMLAEIRRLEHELATNKDLVKTIKYIKNIRTQEGDELRSILRDVKSSIDFALYHIDRGEIEYAKAELLSTKEDDDEDA